MGVTKEQSKNKGKAVAIDKSEPKRGEAKGKGKATVSMKEEIDPGLRNINFEIEDVEDEEPVPMKKAPKKKPKIPVDTYINAFKACEYVSTRWPHKETLEKLGLLDDVRLVLKNIGFEKVLDMHHLTYPNEVAHLLATLELVLDHSTCPSPPKDKLGYLKFFVNGFVYRLNLVDLCAAYGFENTSNFWVKSNARMDAKTWDLIGKGGYGGSIVRSSYISNPAVRYVHKIIAQTFCARQEADKVKSLEMALLTNGIKPLFEEEFARERITGYEDVNLGVILAKQLVKIRKSWTFDQSDQRAKIFIGGFLTPLLVASRVPLGAPCQKPRAYLDLNNLGKTHFLGGRDGDKFPYNFTTTYESEAWIHLPNQEVTRLNSLENLKFLKGEAALVKEPIDVASIARKKKGKGIEKRASPHESSIGCSRYHHPIFQGRIQSEATRHALEGVKKNQRCNKWQSRALHNMRRGFKKKIKGFEETISDMNETILGLKSIVEKYVLRKQSPPRHEDGSSSYDLALEEARRKSISHLPSQSFTHDEEPPRASSYETRAPRRRRRRIPTPSPPSSDNASFHLSDSYSEND